MAGITYNFLPFMALPLYVSLEQIDERLIEAAEDLYASKLHAFLRVTLPLSLPGVVAGTLLTFIPAAGDFINAQLLGSTQNHMIGNVIQSKFLEQTDYPAAAAMSFILMARDPGRGLPLRAPGRHRAADGDGRMSTVAVPARRERRGFLAAAWAFVKRHVLTVYSILFFAYLLLPIAVVIVFSFNNPTGKFNYTWQGFTWDNWRYWDGVPGIQQLDRPLARDRAAGEPRRDRARHADRARARPLQLPRPRRRRTSSSSCRSRRPEIVLGASLLTLFLNLNFVSSASGRS